MARLSDIKPSYSELTTSDRLHIISTIRESRLKPKAQATKAATKRKEERKDIFSLINNMSPEQAQKLIDKLTR